MKRIVLFGLITCAGLVYQVAGQQQPSASPQPAGGWRPRARYCTSASSVALL